VFKAGCLSDVLLKASGNGLVISMNSDVLSFEFSNEGVVLRNFHHGELKGLRGGEKQSACYE
jgi:hypothetical protein